MGVSVFPVPASSAGSSAIWYEINSTNIRSTRTFSSGLYRITARRKDMTASPTIVVATFFNGGGTQIAQVTLQETDTGNTKEPIEQMFFLSSDATRVEIASMYSAVFLSIESITSSYQTAESFQLTYYTTSQNVTITSNDVGWILLGAGGGSFQQGWGGANGSGGGGSGYAVVNTSPTPGTYALTIGAGVVAGNGGASTFAGFTAEGGIAGSQGGNGGNGGSGGGAGGAQGGYGGTNGENGGGSGAGVGSGLQVPVWAPPVNRVPQSTAGGFYTGGGGGNFGTGGQTGAAGTGGGAGGKNAGGSGHAGGSGVLVVGRWV